MRFLLIVAAFLITAPVVPALGQAACDGKQLFTAEACAGDAVSDEEKTLFDLVNKYRRSQNKTELKISPSLSRLANRRMLDLKFNVKKLTHSWSNCPYLISDQKPWGCVIDAPTRLKTGYPGQGYETLYRTTTGQVTPDAAIAAWKKSQLHNSIILNLETFRIWNGMNSAWPSTANTLLSGSGARPAKRCPRVNWASAFLTKRPSTA